MFSVNLRRRSGYRRRKVYLCPPRLPLPLTQHAPRCYLQQTLHLVRLFGQLCRLARMHRSAIDAAIHLAGHRGRQFTVFTFQPALRIENGPIHQRSLLQHRMVTCQQAKIIRVAMPEARQQRLTRFIKLRQRLGGDPRLPTQFLTGKHRRRMAATQGVGLGAPTAGSDR
ncbi:hypothetical protein D3C79_861090 [compost metagenome]